MPLTRSSLRSGLLLFLLVFHVTPFLRAATHVTNEPPALTIEATGYGTNKLSADTTDLLRRDNDLFATGIKMFGAFAIVLAVFGTFVLVVKKWGHLATHTPSTRELNVIEFRILAHKTYLYVIEHGKQRHLISVGQNGTTLIASPHPSPGNSDLKFPSEALDFLPREAGS